MSLEAFVGRNWANTPNGYSENLTLASVQREIDHERMLESHARMLGTDKGGRAKIEPSNLSGGNPLRPASLEALVGQAKLKRMMRRVIDASLTSGRPLDHVLLAGPSGMGKTTISQIVAKEMGTNCYQFEAPLDHETLLALRETAKDGDIVLVDEVHLLSSGDRRGATGSSTVEGLYNILEDRVIVSGQEVLPFPKITLIGSTTDVGLLPTPLIGRLPLKPIIEPYTQDDMYAIAMANAAALDAQIEPGAARIFARASRGVPRVVNGYVRNALSLGGAIDASLAREVVRDLNDTEADGLTHDMAAVLRFLYTRCRRVNGRGEVTYQASVASLATATGHSHDAKAIALHVEPYLVVEGLLAVGSGGRRLTDAGIERARELLDAA